MEPDGHPLPGQRGVGFQLLAHEPDVQLPFGYFTLTCGERDSLTVASAAITEPVHAQRSTLCPSPAHRSSQTSVIDRREKKRRLRPPRGQLMAVVFSLCGGGGVGVGVGVEMLVAKTC